MSRLALLSTFQAATPRQMRRTITCSLFILFCITVTGQKTYKHSVFWGRLVLSDRINDKLKWEFYGQKRTQNIPGHKNIFGGSHFLSAWFWLTYQLNKEVKLSASPFGYFDSHLFFTIPADAETPGVKEFRWVARLEHEKKKWLNYANRYSLEYRLRDLQHNGNYVPNWRVRYQLKLEKPVTGIFSPTKPVTFSLSDEIFIQFGKAVKGNPNVFDQNRIAAGFSYEFLRNIKLAISYLNIRQQRINGKDFDNANVLWVVLTFDNLFSQFKKKANSKAEDIRK